MGKQQTPKPHRLQHEERSALGPVRVDTMNPGDVFVRCGTPCMRATVSIGAPTSALIPPECQTGATPEYVWIVNLTTGSVWAVSPSEQVFPATNVKLTFETVRVG